MSPRLHGHGLRTWNEEVDQIPDKVREPVRVDGHAADHLQVLRFALTLMDCWTCNQVSVAERTQSCSPMNTAKLAGMKEKAMPMMIAANMPLTLTTTAANSLSLP